MILRLKQHAVREAMNQARPVLEVGANRTRAILPLRRLPPRLLPRLDHCGLPLDAAGLMTAPHPSQAPHFILILGDPIASGASFPMTLGLGVDRRHTAGTRNQALLVPSPALSRSGITAGHTRMGVTAHRSSAMTLC